MAKETVKKTLGRGDKGPSVSISVDLDKVLDDAGSIVERSLAKGQLRVSVQGVMASAKWKSTEKKDPNYGKTKATDAEVQKIVDVYKPGEKRKAKSTGDKVKDLLKGLSADDRAQAIQEAVQGMK